MADVETPPARLSFSPNLPTLQTAYDSTSLGELKLCPQKYKYSIIDGYETLNQNIHIIFGSYYASAHEFYNHSRADGKSVDEARLETVEFVLFLTWDQKLNRPWFSEDSNKNRQTLIRSIIWYIEHFRNDPLETVILKDGSAAVELNFRFDSGYRSITGEIFLICGHLDKVAKFEGHKWIEDQKTTKYRLDDSYFARYSPDNQVSLYTVAGEFILRENIQGVIIDAAQILANSTKFRRGFISRTPALIEEWMKDTYYYFQQAEIYAQNNHWPKNDKMCGVPHTDPKTGETSYGCPFREVCSSDPSVREIKLNSQFKRRSWDPLVPRTRKDLTHAAVAPSASADNQ